MKGPIKDIYVKVEQPWAPWFFLVWVALLCLGVIKLFEISVILGAVNIAFLVFCLARYTRVERDGVTRR